MLDLLLLAFIGGVVAKILGGLAHGSGSPIRNNPFPPLRLRNETPSQPMRAVRRQRDMRVNEYGELE